MYLKFILPLFFFTCAFLFALHFPYYYNNRTRGKFNRSALTPMYEKIYYTCHVIIVILMTPTFTKMFSSKTKKETKLFCFVLTEARLVAIFDSLSAEITIWNKIRLIKLSKKFYFISCQMRNFDFQCLHTWLYLAHTYVDNKININIFPQKNTHSTKWRRHEFALLNIFSSFLHINMCTCVCEGIFIHSINIVYAFFLMMKSDICFLWFFLLHTHTYWHFHMDM